MTDQRMNEISLAIANMASDDVIDIAEVGIKVSKNQYGTFTVTGRRDKICGYPYLVLDIVDEILREDNLSQEKKLRKQFFEEDNARIERGIILHRVDHLRLGGDSIRDGVDGSWSEWVPMSREEADAWCQAHGTTFRELFK